MYVSYFDISDNQLFKHVTIAFIESSLAINISVNSHWNDEHIAIWCIVIMSKASCAIA